MKTSPGPWKFGYTDNLEHPIIMDANGEIVCVMCEGVSTEDGKLLAKAPELLEALKVLESAAAFAGIADDVERAAVGAALEYARAVLATPKPVDPVLQMIRDQEAKKNALIAEGICPTCKGAGECGGQFQGGEWTCEDCNGSGRTK